MKPHLAEELAKLKAIVRDIIHHEASRQDASMFVTGKRVVLRRLAGLGIFAHQPALGAHCKVVIEDERDTIIESLLLQNVGSNPKTIEQYKESGRQMRTVCSRW